MKNSLAALPLGILSLALAAPSLAAAREMTDSVVMVNGDRITGQIMGMSRGKLDYKTDDIGRISIEWLKVVQVTSTYAFEVRLGWGQAL